MGSESKAHEAESGIQCVYSVYILCWSSLLYILRFAAYSFEVLCSLKIQVVGQKYRDKTTLASNTRFSRFQSRRFSLLVGYNI